MQSVHAGLTSLTVAKACVSQPSGSVMEIKTVMTARMRKIVV